MWHLKDTSESVKCKLDETTGFFIIILLLLQNYVYFKKDFGAGKGYYWNELWHWLIHLLIISLFLLSRNWLLKTFQVDEATYESSQSFFFFFCPKAEL